MRYPTLLAALGAIAMSGMDSKYLKPRHVRPSDPTRCNGCGKKNWDCRCQARKEENTQVTNS